MRSVRLLAASALAIAATCGVASAQQVLPEGRVYVFHSRAQGSCPALDWHVVVGANNALSGMIAWNDMKDMASVTGTGNPTTHSFTLVGKRMTGTGPGATVEGQIRQDGWLIANIKGPTVNCSNVAVPFYIPPVNQ